MNRGLTGEGLHTAGIEGRGFLIDDYEDADYFHDGCPFRPDELSEISLRLPPPIFEGQELQSFDRDAKGNIRRVSYFVAAGFPISQSLLWVRLDEESAWDYDMRVNAERFCRLVMKSLATTSPWLNLIYGGTFPDFDLTER